MLYGLNGNADFWVWGLARYIWLSQCWQCFSSLIPNVIWNITYSDSFYPLFFNKLSHYPPNLINNRAKSQQTAHLQQNSVCSKLRIYPRSEILHKQRSTRSGHFPCLTLTFCWQGIFFSVFLFLPEAWSQVKIYIS